MTEIDKHSHDKVNEYCGIVKALFEWRNDKRFLDVHGRRMFYQREPIIGTQDVLLQVLSFDPFTGEKKFPKGMRVPAKSMYRRRATNLKGEAASPLIKIH